MNAGEKTPHNRTYKRSYHLNCTVKVSSDGRTFQDGDVGNISSGGMNLISQSEYSVGDKIYIHLTIGALVSEFDIFTSGKIVQAKKFPEYNSYSIKFEGMSEDIRIRIDENIIKNNLIEPGFDDKE